MESSYKKTARDTLINGIAYIVTLPISLIQLALLSKTLGTQAFGLWSLVRTTVSLSMPFTNLGLGVAMARFLAAEKKQEEIQEGFYSVLSVKFIISAIFALVVFLMASPLAMNFFDGAVDIVRITAAIILVATVEPVYLQILRIFRQIKTHSIFRIADSYGVLVLMATLVLLGYGIISVVLSLLAVRFILMIVMFFMIKARIGIKMPNFSCLKEYFGFGLYTLPSSLSFWLVNLSDRYVIGYFLGAASVGIYSAAYSLGEIPYLFSALLNFIMMVAVSKLYDEGRINEVKTHLSHTLKYFLAITLPFIFGAAILGEPILRMFSTTEIAEEGYRIIPIVALGFLFLGVQSIVHYILLVTKKTKLLALTWAFSVPLNLGLNIIVVPWLGIIGAAATTLLAYLLAMGATCYFSLKEFRFDPNWRFIGKSLFASAVMSAAVWFISPEGTVSTLLTVALGVVIYGTVIILLKGFTRNEYEFFKGLLKRGTPSVPPSESID